MASKKVEFHEDAALEYEAAVGWYLQRSLLAASKFVDAISRSMDMIVEAPHRWPAGKHGTRRFLLQRFPFAIVYRELPAAIQVLAIAHARRKPGYWKQRL
jgi:toxin ParE1/3/4